MKLATLIRQLGLLESLKQPYLKLPLAAMRDVGPAVQALGGFLEITTTETFSRAELIAERSWLPLSTARKNLTTLARNGWLKNKGRKRRGNKQAPKMPTIAVTQKTLDSLDSFSILPRWATYEIQDVGQLNWVVIAVLSVVMSQLLRFDAAARQQTGHGVVADDFEGALELFGGRRRFSFSIPKLEELTGLSNHSIITARNTLGELGIVVRRDDFGNKQPDILFPNFDFVISKLELHTGEIVYGFNNENLGIGV